MLCVPATVTFVPELNIVVSPEHAPSRQRTFPRGPFVVYPLVLICNVA
jgi:hypothetical protein